jgi:hypothetical protein
MENATFQIHHSRGFGFPEAKVDIHLFERNLVASAEMLDIDGATPGLLHDQIHAFMDNMEIVQKRAVPVEDDMFSGAPAHHAASVPVKPA